MLNEKIQVIVRVGLKFWLFKNAWYLLYFYLRFTCVSSHDSMLPTDSIK
jgi:hypothetical protein